MSSSVMDFLRQLFQHKNKYQSHQMSLTTSTFNKETTPAPAESIYSKNQTFSASRENISPLSVKNNQSSPRNNAVTPPTVSPHTLSSSIVPQQVREAIKNANIIAIDTETTGTKSTDRIMEIGLVAVNADGTNTRYEHLTNPEVKIPTAIVEKTHIDNAMVNGQPPASKVLEEIVPLLQGKVLVGHNCPFDIKMINNEMKRSNLDTLKNYSIYDTEDRAKKVLSLPNYKLDTLCAALGVDPGQHHRALDDAQATLNCYKILIGSHPQTYVTPEHHKLVEQLVQKQDREKKSFPRTLLRDNYMASHNTTPQNSKPQGYPELEAHGGVDMVGNASNQKILTHYGKGAYFWVILKKGYIKKGKYEGYPTVNVFLNDELIGYLSPTNMGKHFNQFREESYIALAHTRNSEKDTKLKVRIELPKAHEPIDLEPYRKSIAPSVHTDSSRQQLPHVNPRTSSSKELGITLPYAISNAANQPPHRSLIYGSTEHIYAPDDDEPCRAYADGTLVYLRVHRLSTHDNLYTIFLDKTKILSTSLALSDQIKPGESKVVRALVHRNNKCVTIGILLPTN